MADLHIVPAEDFDGWQPNTPAVLLGWRNEDGSTMTLYVNAQGTAVVIAFGRDVVPARLGERPFPDCCEDENFAP